MGILISLAIPVAGFAILYAVIKSAVRSGVEEALRNHDVWLRRHGSQ